MSASQRITSTFNLDEKLFEEYFEAKDRQLNKHDAMWFSIVMAVVCAAWAWGAWVLKGITAVGWVVGVIIFAMLAIAVFEAVTGRTLFWPKSLWRKTYQRFFARHGVDSSEPRPWSFTLRCSATPNHVDISVVHDGEATSTITRAYKEFERIEETEHLIILVTAYELGNPLDFYHNERYGDKLTQREDTEDAIFLKESLQGMDAAQFEEYLARKVRVR